MRRFFAVALLSTAIAVTTSAGELSGRRAPGFALPDTGVQYHDLQDYRSKWVILDIMQVDCPTCGQLAQVLEKIKNKYPGKVAVLSVVNPPSNQAQVLQFVEQHGVTSPILFDCGQMAISYLKVTPDQPGVNVPHVFIIDPDGMIVDDFGNTEANRERFEEEALTARLEELFAAGKQQTGTRR
jgi:peroxiredoxin